MEDYIKAIRSYTDKNGVWWIEFNRKELKELFKKRQVKKNKTK